MPEGYVQLFGVSSHQPSLFDLYGSDYLQRASQAADFVPGEFLNQFAVPLQTYAANFRFLKSLMISLAALWPGTPVTPPPGCEPDPHM